MIVSGGYSKALNTKLDTTLIFANGSWRSLGARLPYAVQNLAMVTLNNQVFLFGNISLYRREQRTYFQGDMPRMRELRAKC